MGGLSALSAMYGPATANQGGILTGPGIDQSVAGGTRTWIRTAQASTAETLAAWKVSDDSTGKFEIRNLTATDGFFLTNLYATGASTSTALRISADSGSDTGTSAVMQFQARIGGTTFSTRPAFEWLLSSTSLAQMSAAGGLKITGGSTPSIQVGASGTAITQVRVYSQSLTPSSVAANTTAEQTFTVSGLTTADKVVVNGPAPTAGTGIVGWRVSAADTLAITFANNTGGSLTPTSGTYNVVATRS